MEEEEGKGEGGKKGTSAWDMNFPYEGEEG